MKNGLVQLLPHMQQPVVFGLKACRSYYFSGLQHISLWIERSFSEPINFSPVTVTWPDFSLLSLDLYSVLTFTSWLATECRQGRLLYVVPFNPNSMLTWKTGNRHRFTNEIQSLGSVWNEECFLPISKCMFLIWLFKILSSLLL